MTRIQISLVVAIVFLVAFGVAWRIAGGHQAASRNRIEAAPQVVESAAVMSAPTFTLVKAQASSRHDRPTPPASLTQWYGWTESQQTDFVTAVQHNSRLPPDILSFFRTELFDRDLGLVTRNNMANGLVNQEIRDKSLAALFKKIVDDPTEDDQWRDYAMQFLAASMDWSDDRRGMAETIWKQALHGRGTMPGTALLQLHYVDERGVRPLPTGYGARLAECLSDPSVELSTRMTAVGIVAQRRMTELGDAVRELAKNAKEPAMRRTALATLGALGDPSDLSLVRRFTADKDPLVAAAAKGAERRLSHPGENVEGPDTSGPSKL